MKITDKHMHKAVEEGIIDSSQAEQLLNFFRSQPGVGPRFDFTHILYYFGGMIAIGAMSIFMNLGWESFGGFGIFGISIVYALIGLKLTCLFRDKGFAIPSGICSVFVLAIVPLAIYGLERGFGFWPDDTVYRDYHRYVKWHWIYMELATLMCGSILLWKFRFPFLMMPIAVTLWYMSMDFAIMFAGVGMQYHYLHDLRVLVSLYFGILVVLLAFWVDIRSRKSGDYAFWLYLFGVITFWGAMSSQHSDSEISKFIYLCINLLLIGVGVVLVRRVFVIFGALGSCFYLGHLAFSVFEDSWLFPISLTAIGLSIVYLGVLWQKNEKSITYKAQNLLPKALRELIQSKQS